MVESVRLQNVFLRRAHSGNDFLILLGPAVIGAAVTAGVTTDSGREESKSTGAEVGAEGSDGFRIVNLTAERHKQVQDRVLLPSGQSVR